MTENFHKLPSIVIVGGGSAGWITANVLLRVLCQGEKQSVKITLVESSRLGTIGVGESTVPTVKALFKFLGIRESEVLRMSEGTFKHGIYYRDWVNPPNNIPDPGFFHPFDYNETSSFNASHWWIAHRSGVTGAQYASDVSVQYRVAAAGKAPRAQDMPDYKGPLGYAYHLDAEHLASFLAERAIKSGAHRIYDSVESVTLNEDGFVKELLTVENGIIRGDIFIDCSGFASILMEKSMKINFKSYADHLFCDSAVAVRVPLANESPIRPYTTATAQHAGWIWEIDLQRRSGVGYVFSSAHISRDDAEKRLREHIGPKCAQLEVKNVSMRVGRSNLFWNKNVVAIGLSGGFIEPLESTGLYLIQAGAMHLAQALMEDLGLIKIDQDSNAIFLRCLAESAKLYNDQMVALYEELRDFIKLHYFLSKRRDSKFWIDNVDPKSLSENLENLLHRWTYRPPNKYDFPNRLNLFTEHSWQYIMLGMQWVPLRSKALELFSSQEVGSKFSASLEQLAENILQRLPVHRDYFAA